MAQITINIPDELDQRVRSYLKTRGEDLASFVARAYEQSLSLDEDPVLQAERLRKTPPGSDDAGRVVDA